MNRRAFLRRTGLVALGAAASSSVVACTRAEDAGPAAATSPSMPTTLPPTSSGPPPPDWAALSQRMDGQLVLPSAPSYPALHRLYDPRFDGVHPAAVARCRTPADVQRAVAFARASGLPFSARSGGHSYAGYSTTAGLVIDVRGLSGVVSDRAAGTATVGAGASMIDVAAALAPYGLAVPSGTCATVGVSGLTLGGGQGIVGRKFGLTSDALIGATVATADGRLLRCDGVHHADLFWACRGGGGGSFGIVTAFTFKPVRIPDITLFAMAWPWAAAADVMTAWQSSGPDAPDELWSDCHLLWRAGRGLGASLNGAYLGSAGLLATILRSLEVAVGGPASASSIRTMPYLDAMLQEAGCAGWSVEQCRPEAPGSAGRLTRQRSYAKSDYFGADLSSAGIRAIVDVVAARAGDPALSAADGGVLFDAWGGALNRIPKDATAFVHRDSRFLAQYVAAVPPGVPAAVSKNRSWLREAYAAIHAGGNGEAYQNYIDPELDGWESAYFGDNLARLRHVKSVYDPDDAFRFPQSIPPAI